MKEARASICPRPAGEISLGAKQTIAGIVKRINAEPVSLSAALQLITHNLNPRAFKIRLESIQPDVPVNAMTLHLYDAGNPPVARIAETGRTVELAKYLERMCIRKAPKTLVVKRQHQVAI